MPGTNLTRDEAAARAEILDVTSYEVALDLSAGSEQFVTSTTLRFTCRTPGAATFADLVDAEIEEITLNGRTLDPTTAYAESRIALDDLEPDNVLVVRARCPYSRSGEGLHRFVDPSDDRVYLYTQFEVPDARRVFCTFEQPDLKSVFTFEVVAPEHWAVVSNSPTPEPVVLDEGRARWSFAPTARLSTYVTAVVAGEYHAVHDVYQGAHGDIALGHYCRQSLVEHLDVEELLLITRQGFEFFEEAFDYPYPFGKYDQLYVPEYNMGAMENAGCVTLRDEYLPRSRQDGAFYEFRCSVILHEMAHMWFGDLVTMRWWDDLWLNESFAEWACHHAAVEATAFTEAWTGFTNARKVTGYRQDQMPSTHPVAADNHDLEAVEVNFDMITYAKGASVLKQLTAWVGLEPFLAGLRQYFKDHAYGSSEFSDLLSALEASSGRELQGWAQEWLQTAGVNVLAPRFEVDDEGRYTSFVVEQGADPDWPTLRRHRLGIGLYDQADGTLVRRRYLETDVRGASTEIADLVGETQPDLLLLNDEDLAYAKIRLDERSQATLVRALATIEDSLARAVCWGAAWDMVRDGEMSASAYVELVLGAVGSESDASGQSVIPRYGAMAASLYAHPEHREALGARWEEGVRGLLLAAEPGSDLQLTFARAFASAAASGSALDELEEILAGTRTVEGLVVDDDLRWVLLTALARTGRAESDRIEEELTRDKTISGQEKAAAALAARPTPEAKAAAWAQAFKDPETANETQRSIVASFMRAGQEDVLAPYLERFLEVAETAYERLGSYRGSTAMRLGFPLVLTSPEMVARVDAWLAGTSAHPGARRYVEEGRAEAVRALAAREADASR